MSRFLGTPKSSWPSVKFNINSLLPPIPKRNSALHLAKVNQLRYAIPKHIVQLELDRLGIVRETEIWIYINEPSGFTAVVGSNEKAYIFEVEWGWGTLVDIVPCKGVRENGSLIY